GAIFNGLSLSLSIEWQRAQYVLAMVRPRCALGDSDAARTQSGISAMIVAASRRRMRFTLYFLSRWVWPSLQIKAPAKATKANMIPERINRKAVSNGIVLLPCGAGKR